MARRTAVLNVVGLTPGFLGEHTPHLSAWAKRGKTATIEQIIPGVTCSVQATYLTGEYPSRHGVVGNGWYFADECEIRFWRQSNRLVQAEKIWEKARAADPTFTCANLFWWYNMYSTVDFSVTPRPMYPADGRKLPDIYTQPSSLRDELQKELGTFPLFDFWGPRAGIKSSQWIAESAKRVEKKFQPTLSLIYLPHLDYNLQRVGPNHADIRKDLKQIDSVCGDLIDFFEKLGVQVLVLSEYGITEVSTPVHLNRVLRRAGLIAVREELGLELLDPGASAAFAVADHQVAHIYINDSSKAALVRDLIERTEGVGQVLDGPAKAQFHLDHPRAGDLIAVADERSWFTYYYWLDDARAPDFARTVDIHRKPGYDPAELVIDPQLKAPMLAVAGKLAKKQLGFRYLMDVIGLDAMVVKGSHGRINASKDGPLFITHRTDLLPGESIGATKVASLLLAHVAN